MSAADRAKARREAILKKGGDRLAKLTTSARGSESGYLTDEQPRSRVSAFVGEDSLDMPKPRSVSAASYTSDSSAHESSTETTTSKTTRATSYTTSPRPQSTPPQGQTWSEQDQTEFLSALMGKGPLPPLPNNPNFSFPRSRNASADSIAVEEPTVDTHADPMMALMSSMGMFPPGGGAQAGANMDPKTAFAQFQPEKPKPKTLGKKLMPLIHMLVMWALLGYFAFWRGMEERSLLPEKVSIWDKWANLLRNRPEGWGAQALPFFWVFTSVQIVLHSMWIVTGIDAVVPPTLISIALPHLPAPFPTIITTGLKYLQMGSTFLDDVASLIVGVGILVYLSTWLAT